jgi:predicted enzyme related to lactoylglutathione lyase
MGQPVVHFEVVGKDGERLQGFYSDMFGWEIDSDNPMNYGIVSREGNTNADGIGIGGGVASGQEGQSYVTIYVSVDDHEVGQQKAESHGG